MNKKILLLPVACLLFSGCEHKPSSTSRSGNYQSSTEMQETETNFENIDRTTPIERTTPNERVMRGGSYQSTTVTTPEDYAPDNTGRNKRDRSSHMMTAGDQSENSVDITITKRVREAIIADDSLSTNAKNIKIITVKNVVTLRGPVKNEREKNIIGQIASSVPGVQNVENQIEITNQNRTAPSTNQESYR